MSIAFSSPNLSLAWPSDSVTLCLTPPRWINTDECRWELPSSAVLVVAVVLLCCALLFAARTSRVCVLGHLQRWDLCRCPFAFLMCRPCRLSAVSGHLTRESLDFLARLSAGPSAPCRCLVGFSRDAVSSSGDGAIICRDRVVGQKRQAGGPNQVWARCYKDMFGYAGDLGRHPVRA